MQTNTSTEQFFRVILTEKGAVALNSLIDSTKAVAAILELPMLSAPPYRQGDIFIAPVSFLYELEAFFGENLWENAVFPV